MTGEAQRGGGGDNKSGIQGEVLSIRVGRDICGSYQVRVRTEFERDDICGEAHGDLYGRQ